jgi:predicted HicB family RNase H-like nuclease
MKRVNIKLEDATHTRAKVISVLKDMTLNEYIERAIEQAIQKDNTLLENLKRKR